MKPQIFLWTVVVLTFLGCGNNATPSKNEPPESVKPEKSQKTKPIDQNVVLNLDSLRGNIQSIVSYYFMVNDSSFVLKKDASETLWTNEDFYDKNGKLTRHAGTGFIDRKYKYNDKGKLIETYQDGDFDYRYIAFRTTYKYDKSGNLFEEIEFVRHDIQQDDEKVIEGKFTENSKTIYQYAADGSLSMKIVYNAENGKFTESRRIENFDEDDQAKLSYNAKGELLFSEHSFTCQFDEHGNWTTKIDYTDVGGDDAFVFIERNIIYY